MRRIEAKSSTSADMKNYTSERTHDDETSISSHGQLSCSYDTREGLLKEPSRDSYEEYSNKRGLYSMPTDNNSCRGEVVYRKQLSSGKSPIRSARDVDNTVGDWERCRVMYSEGSVAPESNEVIGKEEESSQVIDEEQDCQSISELRIPMDDRKYVSTTGGGSEGHLKEMATQQKRRILINTSSKRPCSDLSLEGFNFSGGSPERCWVKMQSKSEVHSSGAHSSGLPRSTSSRCGSTLYRSPNMATPVESQPDGHRKPCEDVTNAVSLRIPAEEDNERTFSSLIISFLSRK